MTKPSLTITTRESPLALEQTHSIKQALEKLYPEITIKILRLTTIADKRLDVSLQKIGGKGLFVKELEEALLDGRADIAVHSMKDVPMELPKGLMLPVVVKRIDPRDAFVSSKFPSLNHLPAGAKVGTSSLRRKTQMLALRRDLDFLDLRGNIHTRLKRLENGDFAAIILAAAGLQRMGLANHIQSYFTPEESLPAAGQGALGLECRENDTATLDLIRPLNDPSSFYCVQAERAVCRRLNGGCQVPIGAYAQLFKDQLHLQALVANKEGSTIIKANLAGFMAQANEIGMSVANQLLTLGAAEILSEFKTC